jgi:hypothetical protein
MTNLRFVTAAGEFEVDYWYVPNRPSDMRLAVDRVTDGIPEDNPTDFNLDLSTRTTLRSSIDVALRALGVPEVDTERALAMIFDDVERFAKSLGSFPTD